MKVTRVDDGNDAITIAVVPIDITVEINGVKVTTTFPDTSPRQSASQSALTRVAALWGPLREPLAGLRSVRP